MSGAPTVAVVGGGVIGLATAWRAAQRGMAVTVIDKEPGTGASHAAAGMLCPVTEVHYGEERLLELNLASAARWPGFAAEVEASAGTDIGYRTDGTVAVAFDADDLRVLDELRGFQELLGLTVERLTSRECRELEPHLSPRVRGGVLVNGDHQVDNRRLVAALLVACERSGVTFERRWSVGATAPEDGFDTLLADPTLAAADRVVIAAGCRSQWLVRDLPVRPVKGQILRLRFDEWDPPLTRNVRGFADGRSVYLVPRVGGELVVGATVEEQGFDTSVTARAVSDLLRAATDLVPEVAELELVETFAGLRPGTPDNAPIIGMAPGDSKVVFATGHYRNGILLAPLTADAVVAMVAGEEPPAEVAPFGAERFGARSAP